MGDSGSTNDGFVPIPSYVKEQRALASQTLQNREFRVSGLPSRFFRPSDLSTTSNSYINISNESTVNESDLLRRSEVNNTSTPRPSIVPTGNTHKVDIAESMKRMSVEMRNPNMNLSTALQKLEEEYNKVQNSISLQNSMFKSAGESQLLADEMSWMKERDLPAKKIDFTIDTFNTSNMSISTFFKQRSEDISNIIPSHVGENSHVSDISHAMYPESRNSSTNISSELQNFSSSESEANKIDDIPSKESLSISKIAHILQHSEETPTKLINYLLEQCPDNQKSDLHVSNLTEINENALLKMIENTAEDSGNFHPSSLTSDKENINSSNIPQISSIHKLSSDISKSQTSLRSTSSLSNLPGGKLPIETTHCELVWGCVKAGKSETKQFTLRNRSSNRLRIQCMITGPLFRIVAERGEESSNSVKLMLHAHETKKFSVIFNPLTEGVAADEILFSPCDSNLHQLKKLSIKLFGYGGIGSVELKNIPAVNANRYCLSLDKVFGRTTVSKTITVFNKGTLPAFASFEYSSKGYRFSNVSIDPSILVLPPNEEKNLNITIKVSREDAQYIENSMSASVFEIGVVKMVSGSEPTRGRIRRVCKLAQERKLELDILSFRLQQIIENEAIPTDIVKCTENVDSLKFLLQGLLYKEVAIMLERDMDCTLVPTITDETSLFQSMYEENSLTEKSIRNSFRLEPASLILAPPSKLLDNIFLISNSESSSWFEISVPHGITVNPQSGCLMPHSIKPIELKIKNINDLESDVFSVCVHIESAVLSTDVKIIFV